MDQDEFLAVISKTLTKQKAVKLARLACSSADAVFSLLDLSFHEDKQTVFRAAWILENVFEHCPDCFYPHLDKFITNFPRQENDSCKRHYTNILRHPLLQLQLQKYPDEAVETLVETVFEWLIDAGTPAAVKANCLDILFDLSKRSDWIAAELREQIHFLLKDGGPAIQARGKRVLKKLAGAGK